MIFCSETGILGYLLKYIREWIIANHRGAADRILRGLSGPLSELARENKMHYNNKLFDVKHGVIQAQHLRTMAQFVQVITCRTIPPISPLGRVIHATLEWYWACRQLSFSDATLASLGIKGEAMGTAWDAFDTAELRTSFRKDPELALPQRGVLACPKMRRALHDMVNTVQRFGPPEYLTTETSEALHKLPKAIYRSYVG